MKGISALRITATTFGVLAGLAGMTHGVGEVLQGSVAPDGIVIHSWTRGPIATNLGGEPAMTLVPNLLVTGVLALLVGLALVVWSIGFVHRKGGGWVLIALSVAMLLVGGGLAPPVIGILAGVAGTGAGAPLFWWRRRLSAGAQRGLARAWPWVYGVTLLNGLFLAIGSVALVYLIGLDNPDLFVYSFFFSLLSVPACTVTGAGFDIEYGAA